MRSVDPQYARIDPVVARRSPERLRRRRDFAAVYARKRSWANPLLALYLLRHDEKSADRETRRFGFVVSKKVAKGAHDRNRLKRRLREICRLGSDRWRRGMDVVFVVRSAALSATYSDLEAAVGQLMRRAGAEKSSAPQPEPPSGV